jgi:hypothetical protein
VSSRFGVQEEAVRDKVANVALLVAMISLLFSIGVLVKLALIARSGPPEPPETAPIEVRIAYQSPLLSDEFFAWQGRGMAALVAAIVLQGVSRLARLR